MRIPATANLKKPIADPAKLPKSLKMSECFNSSIRSVKGIPRNGAAIPYNSAAACERQIPKTDNLHAKD